MIWFTSDLHLGDTRFDLYGKDLIFKNESHYLETLKNNWNSKITKDDIIYVLGDIFFNNLYIDYFKSLNGYKILIKGNYDRLDMTAKICDIDNTLNECFNEIYNNKFIKLSGKKFYLTHFPDKGSDYVFNIVGHVHGLWRVQRNMINVCLDAWNYTPINENTFLYFYNAIKNYYDKNVFAGELDINFQTT